MDFHQLAQLYQILFTFWEKWRWNHWYFNSNFVGDLDEKRSLTWYIFTIDNCTISCKATLQTIVSLFTTEVEYIAITKVCKEAIS